MRKKIACIICGKNNWNNLYNKLVKCKKCGFIRAADKYFSIRPSKLYNLSYFSGIDYKDYQEEKEALLNNFKDRLEKISKFKKTGTMLEIGCAFGYFLSLAEKKFKTVGIDLHSEVTKIAKNNTKKTKILTGDFLNEKIKKESIDIICMFDVIEHLKNPEKYLHKMKTILKTNGIVIIETGDIDAFLPKLQKGKWRLITPPTHLQYFSNKSLINLLSINGFKILKSYRPAFYRTLSQTIYRLTRSEPLIRIIQKFNFSFTINTFDLIFVVAQKSDLS